MKNRAVVIIGSVLFVLFNLFCDNTSNPVEEIDGVKLLAPTGGEEYTVDDTVTIKFLADGSKENGFIPVISIDSGKTWYEITKKSIIVKNQSVHELTYDWIIGQEQETVPYEDTNKACKVKIQGYEITSINDQSGYFTIVSQ